MSVRELVAMLGDVPVGRASRDASGRLRFVYEDGWRQAADAYPLSLSMPLAVKEHPHDVIEPFLQGLLPDNTFVLESWGRQFQVSPRNAFALLAHVGEDCAGAVQLVPPERVEARRSRTTDGIEWLKEKQIAERLRALRADPAATRLAGDTGHFSLAGAQAKTALLREKGRWGVPSGRIPTTHILKPAAGHLAHFIENEHLCLQLAAALGFPTAQSRIMHFDGEPAIVLERYDRARTARGWVRVHQEDLCQALPVRPARKYQNEGGPGAREIVELLRLNSTSAGDDVATFADALAFNWLIAGTDAHAKNYSLLLGPGRVRLAPIYDVASILPYPQFQPRRSKLAMKIGSHYRLQEIARRDWERCAEQLRLAPEPLLLRITHMGEALPDLAVEVASEMTREGLTSPLIGELATRLAARARACLIQLAA
jgi:serine/threonine-protein kinase HipA